MPHANFAHLVEKDKVRQTGDAKIFAHRIVIVRDRERVRVQVEKALDLVWIIATPTCVECENPDFRMI